MSAKQIKRSERTLTPEEKARLRGLREQVDAEKDEIHQRKVPKRGGGADEAALTQRLNDRHGDEREGERDAETQKRGKPRAVP